MPSLIGLGVDAAPATSVTSLWLVEPMNHYLQGRAPIVQSCPPHDSWESL